MPQFIKMVGWLTASYESDAIFEIGIIYHVYQVQDKLLLQTTMQLKYST